MAQKREWNVTRALALLSVLLVISSYETELAGGGEFNSRTKELEIITLGRGLGDCGSLVRYRFVEKRPVPIEARMMSCSGRGRRTTNPYRWPRVRKL